jgi:alkylresorcinol/alkylpyrone synthase
VTAVRITSVGVAHPDHRLRPEDAGAIAESIGMDPRKATRLVQSSQITRRAVVLPPASLPVLESIEFRNDLYRQLAPELSRQAVARALGSQNGKEIGCLVTSSCTGYSIPGWAVDLVETFELQATMVRIPLTESGCSGGALAIACVADYLRSRPGQAGMAVATELCSLSLRPISDEGSLLASLVFGDGSGAAVLETGPGEGLEVIDALSFLVPHSKSALGFDLTDLGFHPVLTRELADVLTAPTEVAVDALLSRNGLETSDIDAWLLHPGGPRILSAIEAKLGVSQERTRWSWSSMLEFGNTSSAAVFDVLFRYLEEGPAGHTWAVLAAFGPGVSIELLLLMASNGDGRDQQVGARS